jgi:ribosomal protein L40E
MGRAMTLVDICRRCGTMFEEGLDHCRRCGASRGEWALRRELRELCPTYTGDEVDAEELQRIVKPIFEPYWDKVMWYELLEPRRRPRG